MRFFILLTALLLSLASPARAGDDVTAAQRRHSLAGRSFQPRRCGSGLLLRGARHPGRVSAGRHLHGDGSQQLRPGLSPQEFRIRRGAVEDGIDRPARSHRRRRRRAPGKRCIRWKQQPDGSVKIIGCVLLKAGPSGVERPCTGSQDASNKRLHAIASRRRARINSVTMMVMLSAFHASPFMNAAA